MNKGLSLIAIEMDAFNRTNQVYGVAAESLLSGFHWGLLWMAALARQLHCILNRSAVQYVCGLLLICDLGFGVRKLRGVNNTELCTNCEYRAIRATLRPPGGPILCSALSRVI
jgi:hypothetical protein